MYTAFESHPNSKQFCLMILYVKKIIHVITTECVIFAKKNNHLLRNNKQYPLLSNHTTELFSYNSI